MRNTPGQSINGNYLHRLLSVQFTSVTQSSLTLWDLMNRSMPGLPVHHQLPEFTQTHVHWVGDAIQPSHPLSSPSPPAPNPSLPGASLRNSAHGKGHEEGGLAYAKAWSSLRKPPVPKHLTPKPESVLCSHLHLWLYGGLSPITISLGEGVNVQLQVNKNSWAWQEYFSLRTPLKVI